MQEGLGHNRYDDGSCDGEGQCRSFQFGYLVFVLILIFIFIGIMYMQYLIQYLLFNFWSFSLCNFVDPPRAALRGLCPNRSPIENKNRENTWHSWQVCWWILLCGLGVRPEHAILSRVLREKWNQVNIKGHSMINANHKLFNLDLMRTPAPGDF